MATPDADEFEAVRQEPDPIRRGRRATELLAVYQRRVADLADLRRAAIDEAHRDRGMTQTEIARALGITRGRVTQIQGMKASENHTRTPDGQDAGPH